MANLYIYEADCENFATLGMCGRMAEERCEFEEVANGMSELTVEHPIDSWGRYRLLEPGRWLKAIVPVRSVPEIDPSNNMYITTVETWTVSRLATKTQRTVYKNANLKKKKAILKAGARVTVTSQPASGAWKVRSGKYVGYMDGTALENRVVQTARSGETAQQFFDRVEPDWSCREQLFRIYEVTKTDDGVTAKARHEFYECAGAVSSFEGNGNYSLMTVLNNVKNAAVGDVDLDFHTNITGTLLGAHYRNQNIANIVLDPEKGVAARWNAGVIRDGDDCSLISNPGFDRGVTLDHGVDLLGVNYTVSWDNVVTHIRPVGSDKNGNPLYLTSTGGLVAGPHAASYPFRRVGVLDVSAAKVSSKKNGITVAMARGMMQDAAAEQFANGADQPEVSVSVSFELLGETPKFAAYRGLKRLFLFDTIGVRNTRLGIDVKTQVCRVVWDCKRERMLELEAGALKDLSSSVSSWQLAGGISGAKIAAGTISAAAIDDDSINVRHLQADSVNADAIQAEAVTAGKLAAGAVTAGTIEAGAVTAGTIAANAVTTDKLAAQSVTTAKLAAGAVTAATIGAQAVTAEKLAAGAVNAQALSAVTAAIANLAAADISTSTLYAAFAHLMSLAAGSIRAGTVSADQLATQLATIVSLTAQIVDVGYAHVKDLSAGTAIITDGEAGSLRIERLAVTSANLLNAVIDTLVLSGTDGKYYAVRVGAGGSLAAEELELTQAEIEAGVTADGRQILADEVNAQSLNGSTVRAQQAILATVFTDALTAGKITANQAVMASASVPALYTTAITALGNSLDLQANQSVNILVGEAQAAAGDAMDAAEEAQASADAAQATADGAEATAAQVRSAFTFDTDGLRTRMSGSKWSTLTAEDGFYIDHDDVPGHVGAFYQETFEPRSMRLGDVILRKTASGGWTWKRV